MFHYKKGVAYKTTTDSTLLYADVPANTLLNHVFCYFVHHRSKFQNMHPYRIAADTDIEAHVATTYPAPPGPPAVPETYLSFIS
jgi:hypothetical protein